MHKLFCFVQKKPELSMSEFKEYYETKHVPLLEKIIWKEAARPLVYKRNYIEKDKEMFAQMFGAPMNPVDFDAITEQVFTNEAHFNETAKAYGNEELARIIGEDEAKFMERKAIRCYIVEEAGK